MKRLDFSYKVSGIVEFTGKELWLLKQCADSHYDFHCRTVFAARPAEPHRNFGKVWIEADLLWEAYTRRKQAGEEPGLLEIQLEDCLEIACEVRATTDQLDTCIKILEPGNRRVLKDEEDRSACGDLSADIRKAFLEIQEEWHQVTYGIGCKITDRFRWHAAEVEKTKYWHDLETPRLRELAEEYLREHPDPGTTHQPPPLLEHRVDLLLAALGRRKRGEDVPRER